MENVERRAEIGTEEWLFLGGRQVKELQRGKVWSVQVVGAGRGPLVRASLSAAQRANRKLRIYAVEKNPNAIISLQNLITTEGCAPLQKTTPRGVQL